MIEEQIAGGILAGIGGMPGAAVSKINKRKMEMV